MEKKAPKPLLGQILEKIAPCIGAKVLMEPTWGIVGRITFRNGKNSYFRYSTLDINRVGAAEISKDKDYANFFLADLGYPVIPGEAFYSDDWAEKVGSDRTIDMACKYAGRIGWPVVVKPNSGSQGRDVQLVFDKPSLRTALSAVFKKDRVALVQQQVKGRDYRVVVLDDKVISAYERIPLSVTGDGVSSVRELLDHKQESFVASSRDTVIQFDDPRFAATLERGERDFSTVPMKDEVVFLLDNANLSSGGDAIDVTGDMHQEFKKLAVSLTRQMGLRLCGVDLMVEGDITKTPDAYWVIEINAAPGLDHYVKTGEDQQRIVEELYLDVLKHMEKG